MSPWLIVALLAAPVAFDRERPPYPHVVANRMGDAFVRFDLPADEAGNESRCRVTAFKVSQDGKDDVLWKTEGWYAHECWLSGDGHLLTRMGPWSRGSEPHEDDLAVAFYADGKLLHAWSTRDLVQDDSRITRTSSHYEWRRSADFQSAGEGGRFVLETLDDLRWTFDIATGEIVKREHVPRTSETAPEPLTVVNGDPVVVDEIRTYYATLSARDWSAFAAHFHPGAVLSTHWTPPGAAAPTLMMSSVADFVSKAPDGPGSQPVFEEWPTDIDVYRDGDMAMAWVKYGARVGPHEALKEWKGVDAITLIRHEDRWRITSVAWCGD